MFDEAFEKLDVDQIALILDEVNKKVEGSIFDPLETTILAIDVPFYPEYRFLDIADHATNPPLRRFALNKKGSHDYTIIDWTFQTIYDVNQAAPIALTDENVLEYVRFFFRHVKGRHGRFIICESSDNVQWKDEPPLEVRKKLNQTMRPMEIVEKRANGVYKIKAYMMLKDALFNVDVFVDGTGKITMSDHEVMIEDIPVMDSVFA